MFFSEEAIKALYEGAYDIDYNNKINLQWAYDHFDDYERYISLNIYTKKEGYVIESTSYDYYETRTKIVLDAEQHIVSTKCSCHYYRASSICGHVGALLLLVNDLNVNKVPFYRDEAFFVKRAEYVRKIKEMEINLTKANKVIDKLRVGYHKNINEMLDYEKYHLFFVFSNKNLYDGVANLTIKVGTNKTSYIIKNIRTFINQVNHHDKVSYGKKLNFVHSLNVFDKFSQKSISFMERLLVSNRLEEIDNKDRFFSINHRNLNMVFEFLVDAPKKAFNYQLSNQDIPFKVKFINDDNYYHLAIVFDEMTSGIYITCSDNYLFKVNHDDATIIRGAQIDENIVNAIFSIINNKLILTKENALHLLKYLKTEDSIDVVDVLDLEDDTYQQEHQINMYGDIEGDSLVLTLEAIMNNNERINILTADNHLKLSLKVSNVYHVLKESANRIDIDEGKAYFDTKDDHTYTFLENVLPMLTKHTHIFVSDTIKRLHKSRPLDLSIGVRTNNNLLEIDIDSLSIAKEELQAVMKAYKRKKKFYKLKNGEILNLDNSELTELDELLNDFSIKDEELINDNIQIPLHRSFYLNNKLLKDNKLDFNIENSFKDFINHFQSVKLEDLIINERFDDILHSYQKYGVKWMMLLKQYGFGGILADDMGLGKTLQVIALLESVELNNKPCIVVCPASLLLNWDSELEKFNSSLKSLCIYGGANERKDLIKQISNYDLIITTYDYLRKDIKHYNEYDFSYIILDEAQYIKNPKTLSAKVVKNLKGDHHLALSGTPIENSLAELWSLFDFLMPAYLYSYGHFKSNYEQPIIKDHDLKAQNILKLLVEPFILRRTKKEVLNELPDKIEKVLKFNFNKEEEMLYQAKLIEANQEVKQLLGMASPNKIMILKILNELRQICCDSRLLYDNVHTVSSKLAGCMEIINTLKERKQKVLLFSSYTSVLSLIEKELIKDKINYYKITGSVNKKNRKEIVDNFQAGQADLLLISLKAGGTGLNLTAANAVIHFDPWWNLAAENQATDRTYRIGQENDVFVYKLIMKNSIEEKIIKLQASKKDIAEMFIENSQGSISTLSKEQILDLFKID
ncbi:MAG: DEAD/DEAH box helicase [Bacilli bacterium]|nr:DEAD/DEAH box helicase [Bacilli bacterium]